MLIKRKKSKRHQLIVGVFPKKIASEIRKIMHISSNWQKDYFLHVSFAGCFIAALYRSESRKWFWLMTTAMARWKPKSNHFDSIRSCAEVFILFSFSRFEGSKCEVKAKA